MKSVCHKLLAPFSREFYSPSYKKFCGQTTRDSPCETIVVSSSGNFKPPDRTCLTLLCFDHGHSPQTELQSKIKNIFAAVMVLILIFLAEYTSSCMPSMIMAGPYTICELLHPSLPPVFRRLSEKSKEERFSV